MLPKDLAQALLPFTAQNDFSDAMQAYLEHRSKELLKDVKGASDVLALGRYQGALKELDRLLGLHAEVKDTYEEAKK